ncbi:AIM24 family protein [Nocardia sp. NBC_01329]|uniref:AIM24 family protein n=1 Tax=Nocardia sp. NBC_01329 TaxID=2903594 RepID=UPI002E11E9EC|nr:AIM24 family protein [Nocardia sp. NBC_01329]
MTALAPGENRAAPGDRLTVTVTCSAPVDVSALLLAAGGKVRSDGDFVFFNQPVGPGVTLRHGRGSGDVVDVRTPALPADIDKVVVTASLDGSGPPTFGSVGSLTATITGPQGTLTFPMSKMSTETAVVCVEIYRRAGAWKVRAVGQGYDDGLAGIATDFGVNVDDEPVQPSPPSSRTDPTVIANPVAGQRFASTQYHAPPAPPPQYPAPQYQAPQYPAQPVPPPGYHAPSPAAGHPPPGHLPPQQPYPPAAAPPPPPVPAHHAPAHSSQQGAQPMHSELFDPRHAEVSGMGIQKQGGKMIKVGVNGETLVRSGAMVAYQGDLQFQALGSGGIGRAIQQRLTGEGVPLMKVTGRGDLFVANGAADVHIIDLDGTDGLTINGSNVLAFDPTLGYDIRMVQGAAGFASNAGLFNCVFSGRGRIAITSHGSPVVLNVDQPTYADPQAAIAWSSSLQTGVKRNDSFGLGRFMGRSTGEGITLSFSGRGFVIVQPSELPPGGLLGGTGGGQEAGQSGGLLGGLLG